MFWQSYKNTLKNLTRSPLFWAMTALVLLVLINRVIGVSNGVLDLTTGEMIMDTDPRFVMPDTTYYQLANNTANCFLGYALPCLIAVSVMLILNRDFGDSFFEIERAGGVKPEQYFGGRLAALASVHLLITAILLPLGFYWYYFSRGGLPGLSNPFADSAVRLLRQYFLGTLPVILMYLGVAYLIGCLLKSGIAAAIGGCGMVLFHNLGGTYLFNRMPKVYRFFNPTPLQKHVYLSYYGTGRADGAAQTFTPAEMMIWLAVMLGFAAAGFAVAYLLTRKREV